MKTTTLKGILCVFVCMCVCMHVCMFDIYSKMYFASCFTKDMGGIILKEVLIYLFLFFFCFLDCVIYNCYHQEQQF